MNGKESCERVLFHRIKGRLTRFLVGSSILFGYIGLLHILGNCALSEGPSEYKVKAAFLYSFTKFVQWPPFSSENSNDPVTVCVFGENPFGGALQEILVGKTFNGKPFAVKEMTSTQETRACLILFVSASERKRLKTVLESLQGAAVLTVGDTQGFAEDGCIIDFVLEDNKMRFEINTIAADRARLKISSKLLSLARIVSNDKAQRR
jgi:YfiR/HmsC-like